MKGWQATDDKVYEELVTERMSKLRDEGQMAKSLEDRCREIEEALVECAERCRKVQERFTQETEVADTKLKDLIQ